MARRQQQQQVTSRQVAVHTLPVSDLTAPIIYFDTVSSFGIREGTIYATFEAIIDEQGEDGGPVVTRAVTAYVRTGLRGLASLKNAADQLTLMTAKPAGPAQ